MRPASMKLVLALALAIFATAHTSVEERLRALEDEIAAIKADNAAMKASTAGRLEIFVDGRAICPEGYSEPNITQGMMLVGRPKNGKTGAVFNRPFDAGEIGRTPAHSHAVSVNDPGHTHVGLVNDPGHPHPVPIHHASPSTLEWGANPANNGSPVNNMNTNTSKTGISVENLPANSSIEVSIDDNKAGEHYPLVYVLICQMQDGQQEA
jgi:hypothetical protein